MDKPKVPLKMILNRTTKPKDVFDQLNLHEHCVYEVIVQANSANPQHRAILFTGFISGAYCHIYCGSYEYPADMMRQYSIVKVKFLTKLTPMDHIPDKYKF